MIANDFPAATDDDRLIEEMVWEFRVTRALQARAKWNAWNGILFFAVNQNVGK